MFINFGPKKMIPDDGRWCLLYLFPFLYAYSNTWNEAKEGNAIFESFCFYQITEAKVIARLHIRTGSSEPLLLNNAIKTKIS